MDIDNDADVLKDDDGVVIPPINAPAADEDGLLGAIPPVDSEVPVDGEVESDEDEDDDDEEDNEAAEEEGVV